MARVEQYVSGGLLLGPGVRGRRREEDFKKRASREGSKIFEVFKVKEEGEHQVASKWRWDSWQ